MGLLPSLNEKQIDPNQRIPELFGAFSHGRDPGVLDSAVNEAKQGPFGTSNFGGADLTQDLSETNHLPGQNYFDAGIKGPGGLIDQQAARGADFFKNNLNYGLDNNQLGGIGAGASDPMAKALASKYQSQSDNSIRGIKSNNEVNSKVMDSSNAANVSKELGAVYSNEEQNYAQQYQFITASQQLHKQWEQAQSQAQAGLYGAIFSGVGAIGGAVVGGPAGAAAGAAGGKALGSSVGG